MHVVEPLVLVLPVGQAVHDAVVPLVTAYVFAAQTEDNGRNKQMKSAVTHAGLHVGMSNGGVPVQVRDAPEPELA